MALSLSFRSAHLRRTVAAAAVVLATGGLILYRSSASAAPETGASLATGKNAASFAGPGAHGVIALSHTHVAASGATNVYAEIRFVADRQGGQVARAPLAMAVVLDTSGSMSGEKIEEARRSVLRLLGQMRDDDEIAVVRYSDTSELVQPLARVGSVRTDLAERIRSLSAGGGTNIPGGLSQGLRALDDAARSRVKRIVLVSDGLDATRAQAEQLAQRSFASGITVSSLGIGLDFDESYMGSLAQNGHGNFGFVKDGAALAGFLTRELEQTATTTVENAKVTLTLPDGVELVDASGADTHVDGRRVTLALGSLFAGDERRVIVRLTANGASGLRKIESAAAWARVGAELATIDVAPLTLVATSDLGQVERGRDGAVFASATSVFASRRQMEASAAYAQGDVRRAVELARQNEMDLAAARAIAPPAQARSLEAQIGAYGSAKKDFAEVSPASDRGKTSVRASAAKELDNMNRQAW